MATPKTDDVPEPATDYELVPLDQLIPHPRNPRKHDVPRIVASIKAHGFMGVVSVQTSTRTIIAGHGRVKAARELGMARVPVEWKDVDDDEALRALLNNNVPEDHATYDDVSLGQVLADLAATEAGLDRTGWELDAPDEAPPANEVTLKPLKQSHVLLSYPLELHGAVSSALDTLLAHEEIVIRQAAN